MIITFSKLVRINNGRSSYRFDRQIQNTFRTDVFENLHLHSFLSLQDVENRDIPKSSSTLNFFPSTSKIGFIGLNLSSQKPLSISAMSGNSLPQNVKGSKDCRVRKTQLLGSPSGRYLQFKELNQPKPIPQRHFNCILKRERKTSLDT